MTLPKISMTLAPGCELDTGWTMSMIRVIPLDRCRLGGGTFVECAGRELAVFRLTAPDCVVVLDNTCPHAGGNLSGGQITREPIMHDEPAGGCSLEPPRSARPDDGDAVVAVVTCPWHCWKFSLDTGVCTHSARARVRRYRSEVVDGAVWVEF